MELTRLQSKAVIIAAAFCLTILCTIPQCSTAPILDKKFEPDHKNDKAHTERIRIGRETQESSLIAATTPAQPLEQPEAEGSTAATTETIPESATTEATPSQCTEEARQASTCRSLKERLQEYLNISNRGSQYPLQGVLNAFSLDDLVFFDLLGEGRPNPLSRTEYTTQRGERICNSILQHHYRPLSVGPCSWHYSCSHDVNRFPTIRIDARLDTPINFVNGDCNRVTMDNVMYFEKEDCMGDPCHEENWVIRQTNITNDIIVGYEVPQ